MITTTILLATTTTTMMNDNDEDVEKYLFKLILNNLITSSGM